MNLFTVFAAVTFCDRVHWLIIFITVFLCYHFLNNIYDDVRILVLVYLIELNLHFLCVFSDLFYSFFNVKFITIESFDEIEIFR